MTVQPSDGGGDMLVSLQVISNSPGLQSEEQLSVPLVTAPSSPLTTAPLLTSQIWPAGPPKHPAPDAEETTTPDG